EPNHFSYKDKKIHLSSLRIEQERTDAAHTLSKESEADFTFYIFARILMEDFFSLPQFITFYLLQT
ncbi:hypothetical protein, partial [Lysinibacillus xylanilyticus]